MKHHIQRIVAKYLYSYLPKLARTYKYLKNSMHLYKEPQQTPMGFKLVGIQSMQNGQFEPEETKIVHKTLKYVDIVINVGANIGYYCCIALSHSKYVVAFEPINMNVNYLLKNIKANNWDTSIEVYPIALSNQVGAVEIYGGGTGASLIKGWASVPEENVALVPCSTMDNVLGKRFQNQNCLIIVDVEGAEQSMLEGASLLIDMVPKPVWMIEISISENQPDGISINPNLLSTFNVFWNKGYDAWTADEKCRAIQPSEIEEVVRTGIDTLHTHNFLFIEKGKVNKFFDEDKSILP